MPPTMPPLLLLPPMLLRGLLMPSPRLMLRLTMEDTTDVLMDMVDMDTLPTVHTPV